ncbi:hypothetical protein GCM10011487_12560 [Steroidobacter agaridevorans]|uniref:Uncharacterized protein n=1 Tax=Steroidobacter agaridevorans TaxID=2695856 RepID=A0A829Y925_9GAMM|nr:hypothetical protein GCM10011487_12560 [Steroidobacter agaridevorans]
MLIPLQAQRDPLLQQFRRARYRREHLSHILAVVETRQQLPALDLGSIDRRLQFIRRHVWIAVPQTRTQSHQPRIQFLQLPRRFSRPSRVLLEQLQQVTL